MRCTISGYVLQLPGSMLKHRSFAVRQTASSAEACCSAAPGHVVYHILVRPAAALQQADTMPASHVLNSKRSCIMLQTSLVAAAAEVFLIFVQDIALPYGGLHCCMTPPGVNCIM
jgi:hypothetical protein